MNVASKAGRNRRLWARVAALLAAMVLVVAACGDDDSGETTTTGGTGSTEGVTYKVGFVVSETGPGSGLGIPEANTARMLAEQWADGIVGPDGVHHDIEVIIFDDESDPDVAGTLASRLINEEQVDVLVAGTLSGNALTMAPLAEEAEIAMISMASARSIVEADGETRHWIFKTPQNNEHSAEWQRDYLVAQGISTVCYLFENGAYGQDTLNSAKGFFPDAGIEIVFEGSFDRTDTDFPIMAEAQASGCEAVVVGSIPPGSSSAAQAVFDFMPGVEVIGGHGSCNAQYINLAPEAVDGTVLPCGKLLFADTLPDDDPQKALLLQYITDYEGFTGGEAVSTFGGHAWDALMWSLEALSSLDEGPDLAARRIAIRDSIEAEITNWPGTGGVFNITSDDHLGLEYTGLGFVKVVDGWFANFPPSDW